MSAIRLWLGVFLAVVVGPAGLVGVAGPLPQARAATVFSSQTLSSDTVWTASGSPYWIQGTLKVAAGVRLTIEPGVVVKLGNSSSQTATLQVDGQLIARGTAAAPIVFTSAKDDSVVGETNGDGSGSTPGKGDWQTVRSDAELQDVHGTLSRGGTPIEVPGYKRSWIERPDGVRIGLRDASKSGGRTIDIRYPDGTIRKVHTK